MGALSRFGFATLVIFSALYIYVLYVFYFSEKYVLFSVVPPVVCGGVYFYILSKLGIALHYLFRSGHVSYGMAQELIMPSHLTVPSDDSSAGRTYPNL